MVTDRIYSSSLPSRRWHQASSCDNRATPRSTQCSGSRSPPASSSSWTWFWPYLFAPLRADVEYHGQLGSPPARSDQTSVGACVKDSGSRTCSAVRAGVTSPIQPQDRAR
eukprot:519192-Rhodomonas_salina.2